MEIIEQSHIAEAIPESFQALNELVASEPQQWLSLAKDITFPAVAEAELALDDLDYTCSEETLSAYNSLRETYRLLHNKEIGIELVVEDGEPNVGIYRWVSW